MEEVSVAAKQSSLERIFILPFVGLILCLALSIAWVLYRSAEKAAETIANTVLEKAAHHLRNAIHENLSYARIVMNAAAPHSIPQHASVQEQLWTVLRLFPDSGRQVVFCSESGRYVGITRLGDHRYEIGLREKGREKWTVYASTGPGEVGQAIRSETYDPRKQRWYRQAVNYESEILYAHRLGPGGGENLLTLAKPVYTKQRGLLGVMSTELSLNEISRMLQTVQISRSGIAFIIDRSGKLIASSETPADPKPEFRKTAVSDAAPTYRLARDAYSAFVAGMAHGAGNPGQVRTFDFDSTYGKARAAAVDLHENGLDWILIAASPHADFRSEVERAVVENLLIGLAAMALALLLGYLILRRALYDIRQLTAAVKNIGRGESSGKLNIERSDEIGQLAKSFQQIERSLRTDKLTSVLNRDSLIAQIDFHCSVGREVDFLRFTILFIDLDGFKQINDLYGHDEGDRVLSESAQRLQQAIRREDAVARFGGDEFVVYLHGVGEAGTVAAICEKIRASLEAPIHLRQGAVVYVGASIGHASFPEDGLNSDVLLRIADNRMFFDKKLRKSSLQLPLQ